MIYCNNIKNLCFNWISSVLYCHTDGCMITDAHLLTFFLFLITSVFASTFKIKFGWFWRRHGNTFSLINLKKKNSFPLNLFKIKNNVFHIIIYLLSCKPESSLKKCIGLRFKCKPNAIMHYFGVSNILSKKLVGKKKTFKKFWLRIIILIYWIEYGRLIVCSH